MDELPMLACVVSADRPAVISRHEFAIQDMTVVFSTQDIHEPTVWRLAEPHHTLVVHLSGTLHRMQTVFSRGPASTVLPAIGDIWVVPAGCDYVAKVQGERVRFAEYRVPVSLLGGGELTARVGHRDPFFYRATERAAALAEREDELGRMTLSNLLQAQRFHIADVFLGKPMRAAESAVNRQRFSDRQKARLIDYVASSMHEPMDANDLAAVAGVSATRLVEGFKASFGTTPWQYVLRARLAEARRLLETGDASVTAISAATGFSSPSHLATSFSKHFGLSPVAYRREPRDRLANTLDRTVDPRRDAPPERLIRAASATTPGTRL